MQRDPDGLTIEPPGALPEVRDLCGTVQEVLQIRRLEPEGIVRPCELRGHPPGAALRDLYDKLDRPRFRVARPHEGRRHIQVRVCAIDARVGSVGVIAVQRVGDGDRATVSGYVPLMIVRTRHRDRAPALTRGAKIVDVLRKLV